jgi:hypothetical protein
VHAAVVGVVLLARLASETPRGHARAGRRAAARGRRRRVAVLTRLEPILWISFGRKLRGKITVVEFALVIMTL